MKNSDAPNEPRAGVWPKQFQKSLGAWAQLITESQGAEPYDMHLEAVAELSQRVFSGRRVSFRSENKGKRLEWEDRGQITQTFFNALLIQQMSEWLEGGFDMLLDTLESEIEVAMLYGIIICARDQWMKVGVQYAHPDPRFSDHLRYLDFSTKDSWRNSLEIEPQAWLGEFRVDFLLTFKGEEPIPSNQEGEVQSRPQEFRSIEKKMIVECDGHDFHEKTKEQAKRDKSRDRILQSLGFPVYHYTGSEIWKDVFGAASQAIRDLTGKHPQNLIQ